MNDKTALEKKQVNKNYHYNFKTDKSSEIASSILNDYI